MIVNGHLSGDQQGAGTQESCCALWLAVGDGISFGFASGQSFWLRVLPGDPRITQPRQISARRILGGW